MEAESKKPVGALRAPGLETRELDVARELAHAFLTANHPLEVYRLALDRVTPLVRANFGSVFLLDPENPDLLKLACAHNWPQSSARFLGQLRVRVGRGPTGRAVAEQVPVEVPDLFSDPENREWWEPARELGFASMITLPLEARGEVVGALSFYFVEPHPFEPAERRILSLIADQLAATAEKAYLIEDLKAANERLRRQNEELTLQVREAHVARQLKNEFLANISHELRTPLTSILGYTYLLRSGEGTAGQAGREGALDKIEQSANLLLRLIGDLLELSQLKLGRVPVQWRSEDAVALAERAAASMGDLPQGVTFGKAVPDEPLPVRTDGEKVTKILENLLSNARKFTTRGEITLQVRRVDGPEAGAEGAGRSAIRLTGYPGEAGSPPDDGWIEWRVTDTGIGISPENLAAIFDEFRQVDGSSTRLYGGSGLGLALSLRLAALLGGDLRVSSDPGRGSSFALRLPVRPREDGLLPS